MNLPLIDVIIPCYNASDTLERAVVSVLQQSNLGSLWLIDDGSNDNTYELALQLSKQYLKVQVERMPYNAGVAKARNWGAMISAQSTADFVAFLDADDVYEMGALEAAAAVFQLQPDTSLVRLALKPIGLATRYLEHTNFDYAWRHMCMTGGGNTVFRKSFFLACGGFPTHQLFREYGGEDGALGIATTKIVKVVTLFENAGVLYYCYEGTHAYRLLDAILFDKLDPRLTDDKFDQAEKVTESICHRVVTLKDSLNSTEIGLHHLLLENA